MSLRDHRLAIRALLPLLGVMLSLGTTAGAASAGESAPLAAASLGLIPASGPPGMTVTATGSGWTPSNSPYKIFWNRKGGPDLGTFSPNGSGGWSTSIHIPSGADNGAHDIVACEGYGGEFEQCNSATFTVVAPTRTVTPTRTRTPTPSTPLGPVTWTPTFTSTPLAGCDVAIHLVSPLESDDLGGVAAIDLVLDVYGLDPDSQHISLSRAGGGFYAQWPDPSPGTTVEVAADPADAHHLHLTVRAVPMEPGYNSIFVDVPGSCAFEYIYRFANGVRLTTTPRPDACGGLGLPAESTIINFDTYGRPADYLRQLSLDNGVRFEDSLELVQPTAVSPHSAFGAAASVEGLEFGSAMLPIRMAFDRPLKAVGLYVGLLEARYVATNVRAVLSAYGYHPGSSAMVLLGSDSVEFPAAPTDVTQCLRFTAAKGDLIVRALLEYTDTSGASLAERRLIDDLTLDYAEAELPPDRPPTVEITSPTDGSSISGTTVYLRATLQDDRHIDRVHYQIDGGPEVALGAVPSLTDPTSYSAIANFSASLLSPGVPHRLTVTAFDSAGQYAQDDVTLLLPTPVPSLDLQAVKVEVIQAVQCLDDSRCADNAIPLLTGKPTWLRLYVRAEGGSVPGPVRGRLCRGRVATCDSGMVLSMNRISPDGDENPSVNDRGNLDASLNFIVPPAWLTEGTLDLTAFVNYAESEVDEIRLDNNAVQASVLVLPARSLTVMFQPVTAGGRTADIGDMAYYADWLARVYPVSRVIAQSRPPLRRDFDLSDSSGGGCGRTWNVMMDALSAAYSWSGRGTAYLFGLVPNGVDTGGVFGCGLVPGRVAAGITTGPSRSGPTIGAQELGHNFGRQHATDCGHAASPDLRYPRRNGLLDEWGFDVVLRQLYPPDSSYDYMGYCGNANNIWTSAYTYLALLRTLPVADVPPAAPHLADALAGGEPMLVGGGEISPEGFTTARGFYRTAMARDFTDGLPPGPYTAQLLDSAEGVLSTRDFGLLQLSNGDPTDSGSFQIALPDLPEARAIAFLYLGSEIGRVTASANSPQVSIVEPVGGEDWGTSGAHAIAWQARDADGDPLRFNVQYSADGGNTWASTDVDLTDVSSISIDSADLPGGNLLFRVLATDGLNTAVSTTSKPVTVGDKPPLMHLTSPADGDWLPAGEAAVFRGYAADMEDPVLADEAYRWTSDRDGELGSGPTLWGLPLSAGTHRITLTVTDRAGHAVAESVAITVGGSSAEAAPARPPALALLMVVAGLALVLAVAAGVMIYVLWGRPARR